VNEQEIIWHLEHKRMGFADPVADLIEALYGKEYCDKLLEEQTEGE
jgi:hypothetical protein